VEALRYLAIPIGLVAAAAAIMAWIGAGSRTGAKAERERTLNRPAGPLVWADEFRGPRGARPDPDKWRFETGFGWGDGELQYYRRANAALDGAGHLAIEGRMEAYTDVHGVAADYTSARLNSDDRFEFAYGRIEARIRVPAGRGLVAAFWALGTNLSAVGWPASGEIDVMEVNGAEPRTLVGNLHGPRRGHKDYSLDAERRVAEPLSDRFHVYGVSWAPGRIAFSFDGKVYAVRTRADLPPHSRWSFARPFFLVMTLAIGGRWAGPPSAATPWPATMLVDWVRAWSRGSSYCPKVASPPSRRRCARRAAHGSMRLER
jgi:beta-glucanase (GH16 family)